MSLDALACQPEIAEQITGRGGDYLLALKGNQKKAHAEVKRWFAANAFALGALAAARASTRSTRATADWCAGASSPAPTSSRLAALADWPGLTTVLAVETIRGITGRARSRPRSGTISPAASFPRNALAAAIRSHWGIENGLHWVLDVGFREDASRVRERNAARNLALLRKIALNFARANTTLKASLKGKRKSAGWDDDFMATLIAG